MNKNLKKVISSVVALALSLGSLSAFAASYTDVAETANYATAVSELSALGIVNGYDDGTFKPDQKVTRAEVTKMIVAALAQTAAADAAKGATAFSDVAADHWASGFINVGSNSSGFINGMGDGTFAPESNVTYAQLVKMLVTSLGYGGMALQEGGYPTGYITVGDRIGVTKSVVANANEELTRGQVALLIDNSINLPLLVTTIWSAANPEYEIKDGKGSEFQSLLTEYHDTYKVEGKIVETSKSGNLEAGEANFEIAVADRFDDDEYFTRNGDEFDSYDRTRTVIVADGIDATSSLFAYSTALIYKNEDDEYELISLNSSAKSKTVELAAGAFDDDNTTYDDDAASAIVNDNEVLKYYATDAKTGKVTDYKLSYGDDKKAAELWVNGVKIGAIVDDNLVDEVNDYIVENEVGTVTLVDAPQEGKATTDGYYDYVLVDYYVSAMVEDVHTNGTVYFGSKQTGMPSNMKFDQDDVENGDLEYTITLDGKEIDYTDLQEDDVLAISYDVTADKFADSEFYDVIVTRGAVEGKISSADTDDETYTVSGTAYKYDEVLFTDGVDDEAVGMDATLYVDAFGRIVKLEESSSSKKYAIAENVWYEAGPAVNYLKLVMFDGTTKDYEVKNEEDVAGIEGIVFAAGTTKNDIFERVVTYKVNSSNQVYAVEVAADNETANEADEEYIAKSNKVGSVKMNDNTTILDASDYVDTNKVSDLKTVSSLVDDSKYTIYGFDKLSDNTYSYAIITEGIGGYTDDTQVAVFVKSYMDTDSEGESTDAITVLYNGEEVNVLIDELDEGNVNDLDDLNKGDVITFQKNASDEITRIDLIAAMNLCSGTSRIAYGNRDADVTVDPLAKWTKAENDDTEVELMYGVVTDKNSGSVELTPVDGTSKDAEEYDLDDDTKVYVYDYTQGPKAALYVGTTSDIVKTSIGDTFKDEDTDDILWDEIADDESMSYSLNYAFVKAVDGNATEVVVVIAPGEAD